MIVSESGSIDRQSNSLSIFGIVDMLEIKIKERLEGDELPTAPLLKLFISACWRIDESEYGVDYESEMLLDIPGGDDAQSLFSDTVQFKKPFHRFNARIEGPAILTVPGDLTVTNRVRKAGTKKWLSQSYSLVVQVNRSAPDNDPQLAESKN
tara:strand:- start:1420 stop:1875 length:456 start_codon:yes stop_codon:yes gene_type:complete